MDLAWNHSQPVKPTGPEREVRMDTVGSDIESLTYCQTNSTRVGVRTVRRDTDGPGMQ